MNGVLRAVTVTALLMSMLPVLGGPAAAQEPSDPGAPSTAAELEDERTEFAAAEAAWAERPWDSYYTVYRFCTANVDCTTDQFCELVRGCSAMEMEFTGEHLIWRADVVGASPTNRTFRVETFHAQIADALAADPYAVRVSYNEHGVPTSMLLDLSAEFGDETVYAMTGFNFLPGGSGVNQRTVTVTCLNGGGRIDVNMVNSADEAATYRLQVGNLSPRERSVQPRSIWRSPATGRPDGEYRVTVTRDGAQFIDRTVTVSCDQTPAVMAREIEFISWCIGGNGIVFVQLANPRSSSQAYILDVGGIRRSTTAGAYGAAYRGISGRPNGAYEVTVEVVGRGSFTWWVEVRC